MEAFRYETSERLLTIYELIIRHFRGGRDVPSMYTGINVCSIMLASSFGILSGADSFDFLYKSLLSIAYFCKASFEAGCWYDRGSRMEVGSKVISEIWFFCIIPIYLRKEYCKLFECRHTQMNRNFPPVRRLLSYSGAMHVTHARNVNPTRGGQVICPTTSSP
jgi:hypothetical protein